MNDDQRYSLAALLAALGMLAMVVLALALA